MTPDTRDNIRHRAVQASHSCPQGGLAYHVCRADIPALLAALEEAEKDAASAHVQLNRVSGALVDAATVVVEPYDEAIRELTRQRGRIEEKTVEAIADWLDAYAYSAAGPTFSWRIRRGDWRPK